ncbi:hypothetical protein GGI23_005844, partial [Coemansia sp. RSA 2559]
YIISACVFSIGPPYRQSNLRNIGLVTACVALVVYTSFLVIRPNEWAIGFFELVELSSSFKRKIVLWALVNLALCSLGEWWLFPLVSPYLARGVRIVRYFVRRHVLSIFCQQRPSSDYTKLASSAQTNRDNESRLTTEYIGGNGSPSETIGGNVEDGRILMTWEEIARKTETKPFKRILREMGIPAWY